MTQFELDHMLFDDILAPDLASHEHEAMCAILASEGARVDEVADLLGAGLHRAPPEVVADLTHRVADRAGNPGLGPILQDLGPDRLAAGLIEG